MGLPLPTPPARSEAGISGGDGDIAVAAAQPCRAPARQPEGEARGQYPAGDDFGRARRDALSTRLARLPEAGRLCHGDFHPSNILGSPGDATLVDWLDASCGDPAADVCRSYVVMKPSAPDFASAYVDAYTRLGGESRERIFGWLPFVAAARLAEGIASEADGLMEMAGSI